MGDMGKPFANPICPGMEVSRTCDVSTWPNKDHGLVCGDCKVLVDKFDSLYGNCNGYCQDVGRSCVGAWEESHDTCSVKFELTCDQELLSSDAICQCGAWLTPPPTTALPTAFPTTQPPTTLPPTISAPTPSPTSTLPQTSSPTTILSTMPTPIPTVASASPTALPTTTQSPTTLPPTALPTSALLPTLSPTASVSMTP